MNEWIRCTTADLIRDGLLEIGDGYRAKNVEFVPSGGLPFVRVGDVGPSILRVDGIDELPSDERAKYEPKVSRSGDSLITMKGTVGRVAFVTDDSRPFVYSPQISYWRSHDREVIYPRWLRYWLESPEFAWQAAATKGATDMADYINLRDQRRMQISLPPIHVQKRIAEILGSIDDLIGNDRRRAEVLEETARAIYREWFVRFRYPGHEDVSLVDSRLGPIPESWEVEVSGELRNSGVLEIGDGYRAKNAEMSKDGGGLPFIRVANVRDGHLEVDGADELPTHYLERLRSKVSCVGDVVISMKGTVGRQAQVEDWHPRMAYSPQVSFWRTLEPHRISSTYLYQWIRSEDFAQQCAAVKGATDMADYVNLTDQRRMSLLIPPVEVMAGFTSVCSPLRRLIGRLQAHASSLLALRQLVLPRLVTGQIDVSRLDLDALTEAATA